ncbi:hypothetical protein DICPUDRAFT_150599 [Dictyostelium purpureum]|uniref:Uncharacterized protein n=1 Tax=Dictyostelium purpureum TaxID=5786 RepID=F0ZGR5_DICPU|nr:uncharacterized protein DICPUDRAFT_150599 [Dictyostelium purpureum]EGC36891.1 hypothetical protein DICPUDRAFT_150599 [Dictyostelium purpureum]|eukprot:XP_003286613.1 hypothetical protein DICPUDRAFT_150599 [Dictyostelium purpureum]
MGGNLLEAFDLFFKKYEKPKFLYAEGNNLKEILFYSTPRSLNMKNNANIIVIGE